MGTPAEEVKREMIRRAFQQDLANLVERKNAERVFKALKQKTRMEEIMDSISEMSRQIRDDYAKVETHHIQTMAYKLQVPASYMKENGFLIDPLA